MLSSRFFYLSLGLVASLAARLGCALQEFDSWPHQRIALDKVSIHFRYAGTGPPLLLVHGNPQYSLTWRTIGPILAEKYTVIAPDNRGAGDSSIPPDGDYTAVSSAEDLKAVLDFLNITSAYVFSHDKGTGMAYALAAKYPSLVRMLGVSEYILPGFGYAETSGLAPYWDLYQNWQLAFFGVTDAAEFFISGKERQMLEWYFFHGSYSGGLSVPNDVVTSYTDSISKPGFLRAMLGPFSAQTVAADTKFFNSTLGTNPVTMPVLALGGEASMGVALELGYSAVTANLTTDIVPKAGHWIADENPTWVAGRIARFLAEDPTPLPSVNLSSLADQVTLTIGFLGTLGNAALYVGI